MGFDGKNEAVLIFIESVSNPGGTPKDIYFTNQSSHFHLETKILVFGWIYVQPYWNHQPRKIICSTSQSSIELIGFVFNKNMV